MTALDRLLIGSILAAALLAGCWVTVTHYGTTRYEAGQAAAVTAGAKLRQAEAERNRQTESSLRAQLAAKDAAAFNKEKEYASNLEAAQRRVRAGTDRLLCPASAVPASTAAPDRSAAGGVEVESAGPSLMPEAAADLLGVAGDVAGLVRRYERLEQRFEACRALNTVP
jgi:hypothetical protein